MPKGRGAAQATARGNKGNPSRLGGKPRLIILVITLTLLFLYTTRVFAFAASLQGFFGVGGAVLIIALGVLAWFLSKEPVRSGLKHFFGYFRWWRWYMGGLAFLLAAFGILAFFDLGGRFGTGVIGARNAVGGLKVAALLVIGGLFVRTSFTSRLVRALTWVFLRSLWHFSRTLGSGLWEVFKRFALRRPPRAPVTPAVQTPLPQNPVSVPRQAPAAAQPTAETSNRPGWLPPITLGKRPRDPAADKPAEASKPAEESGPPIITSSGWQLPPLNILELTPEVDVRPVDNERRARLIEESLASYGVEAKVVQINPGPTVTQFGLEPGWDRKYKEVKVKDKNGNIQTHLEEVSRTRVKVDRINNLSNDLSLALAAHSIRIEAPVPGKPLVGIEVPNTTWGVVALRSVLEGASYQRLRAKAKLAVGLGKGTGGEAVVADLAKMPHLLVAGATGSGKTVFLHSIICSLLMSNTPDDMRIIMIDPKRVEMVVYNPLPHQATPVVVEAEKAVETLRWLNKEMDERYRRFAAVGARHIEDYNKSHRPNFPYLVLVIDELADLMMTAFEEVEQSLCRLAQLSRATGIHLVVATQRPSVDVVTGLIKANFPTRISFAVTSLVDSRTILDTVGAEKLLGRGDMLYLPTDAAKPKRLQGCFVSDPEMDRLVAFWGKQKPARMSFLTVPGASSAAAASSGATPSITSAPPLEPADPLLEAARRLMQEHKQVSASFLQRRLQIGYNRAAQLMDALEREKEIETGTERAAGA
ncbi:MAG: DNA translocase FtsK [Chloroflexi bacterium]|nr:DNA translocase FtsK [Chloroflexota bacterium]